MVARVRRSLESTRVTVKATTLLLATLLLTAGAPATPPPTRTPAAVATPPAADDYYPLRIGTSWTYMSTLRGEFTNSVVDTTRSDGVLWYRVASTDARGATQNLLMRQDGERIIQRLPNGSELLLVDFAVPVGDAFVAQQNATVTFVAQHDTLTVLGARYSDVRHYRYLGGRLQYDVYYARGVGQVAVEYVRDIVRSRLVRATIGGETRVFAGPTSPPIPTRELQPTQVENLALLAEVWGFLKYHHPAITRGDVDWDAALLNVLPPITAARDRAAALAALDRWVAQPGAAPPCAPCATVDADVHLAPDNDWIHDSARLGPELSARLADVHRNRSTAPAQRYVSFAPGVGNPQFAGEASYLAGDVPDAGFRLLALFRYWNVIRYWFPYRDLIDDDWHDVLREFIPALLHADDDATYRLAMLRLAGRIQDTHAGVSATHELLPPQGSAQLPVVLRFVEGRAVVTGYSHAQLGPASGLEVGDVVLRIDDAHVDSLVAAWAPYHPASNEPARLRDMARTLTRGAPGAVRVTVLRDGTQREITAERVPVASLDARAGATHDLPGSDAFRMLDDDVAYLKLSAVRVDDVPQYFERAADAAVFVVDIRNYPAQFVPYAIGGRLVAEPTPFAMFTNGDASNPGAFGWTAPAMLQPQAPRYTGTVVILVDETSISQSEFTAMALRAAPGAIVVGSTTAGADGNVSVVPLPGGPTTTITGIGVFYPDRSPTQRIGILPDLEVRPTIAGIRAGRDEVLEAGVSRALGRAWRLPEQ
jgi:C-terminal processing protease CtpA/Prc